MAAQTCISATLLLALLGAVRAWDPQATPVNIAGAQMHVELANSELKEGAGGDACANIMAAPNRPAAWQKEIEDTLGQHVFDRASQEVKDITKIQIPRADVRIQGLKGDMGLANKRLSELNAKLKNATNNDAWLEKKAAKARATIKTIRGQLEGMAIEKTKMRADYAGLNLRYQKEEKLYFSKDQGVKDTKKLTPQRTAMRKAQNETVDKDAELGKLMNQTSNLHDKMDKAILLVNKAHYNTWKPKFYKGKVDEVKKHVQMLKGLMKKEQAKKKRLEKLKGEGSAAMGSAKGAAKTAAAYPKLVKIMFTKLKKAMQEAAAKAIGEGDMKILEMGGENIVKNNKECPNRKLDETVCDYLGRARAATGEFKGMVDSIMVGAAGKMQALMAKYYKDGPIAAAKSEARLEAIKDAFDSEFRDKYVQKSIYNKAKTLFEECVFYGKSGKNQAGLKPKGRREW